MSFLKKILATFILMVFMHQQMGFADRITDTTLIIGKPTVVNKSLQFDVGVANKPTLRANATTGVLEFANDGTGFRAIGSGSGGLASYLANKDFETDASGASSYLDAAGTNPVDGTGGSPTHLTLTRNTSTPLDGTGDLKIAKSTGSAQGEGVSQAFSIPRAFISLPHMINFAYDMSDALYTAGDIVICVYDVTNSALVVVSGADVGSCKSVPKSKGVFQATFNATTSTSYRLIEHISSTSTAIYNAFLDDIVVTNQVLPTGVPVGDWTFAGAMTITGNGTSPTKGTVKVDQVKYRRVADSAEIEYSYLQQGAGSSGTSTIYYFAIPSAIGLADMNYHYGAGTPVITDYDDETSHIGTCSVRDGGLSPIRQVGKAYLISSSLIGCDLQSTNLGNAAGGFGTARVAIGIQVKVKIATWSGSANIVNGPRVEYACNNSTNDANDTTSFSNDPEGCQFVNITAARSKRLRFLYAQQQGDQVYTEFFYNGKWKKLIDCDAVICPATRQGSLTIGMGPFPVASSLTDWDMDFGAIRISDNATYGSASGATNWSGIAATSATRWRMVKRSGNSSEAFADAVPGQSPGLLSHNGVKGRVDGASPANGYVGEYYVASGTTNSTTSHATQIDCTTSIPLTAGGWILMADGTGYLQPPNTGVTVGEMRILNVTDNVSVRTQSALGTLAASASAGNSDSFTFASFAVISISSPKSYKVQLQSVTASGSPATAGIGCRASDQLVAMRIF